MIGDLGFPVWSLVTYQTNPSLVQPPGDVYGVGSPSQDAGWWETKVYV